MRFLLLTTLLAAFVAAAPIETRFPSNNDAQLGARDEGINVLARGPIKDA